MDEAAVMEAPVDTGVESPSTSSSPDISQGNQEQQQKTDDPYSSKAAREASQALKAWRDANPENAKHARTFKDAFAANYALRQLEPKGLDGVREKYTALDSVVHGELKGVEAVGALQDELRNVQEIDNRLMAGDAGALTDLGPEFVSQALPQLAGPILDMVRDSNPEAYSKAVLPHFVQALQGSELVANHNAIVEILNEQAPAWLPQDRKDAWLADKMQRLVARVGANSNWLNAQQQKVGELPKGNPNQPQKGADGPTKELETLRREQETQHWNTNINPKLDAHADKKFDELMRPYDKRLKLSKEARSDLKQAWIRSITDKAKQNPAYRSQMQRYNSQSRPDPKAVVNYAKVEFDRYASSTIKSAVEQRYGSFLNGRPRTAAPTPTGARPSGPSQTGVQYVSVKPKNIDFKNTPLDWMHQRKYKTTDGKVVQVR